MSRPTAAAVALTLLLSSGVAHAAAGIHPPAVNTWDTRASSVTFGYQQSLTGPNTVRWATYSSNFTDTSGRLSSQFGAHYTGYREEGFGSVAHGIGAGAVTLYQWPLIGDIAGDPPDLGLAVYGGPVPTVVTNGPDTVVAVPIAAGVGLPWSPLPWLTITPSGELAPTLEVSTAFEPTTLTLDSIDLDTTLTAEEVQEVLTDAVHLRTALVVPWRAGVHVNAHVGLLDAAITTAVTSVLTETGAHPALLGGLNLAFHWDRPAADCVPVEPGPASR